MTLKEIANLMGVSVKKFLKVIASEVYDIDPESSLPENVLEHDKKRASKTEDDQNNSDKSSPKHNFDFDRNSLNSPYVGSPFHEN